MSSPSDETFESMCCHLSLPFSCPIQKQKKKKKTVQNDKTKPKGEKRLKQNSENGKKKKKSIKYEKMTERESSITRALFLVFVCLSLFFTFFFCDSKYAMPFFLNCLPLQSSSSLRHPCCLSFNLPP